MEADIILAEDYADKTTKESWHAAACIIHYVQYCTISFLCRDTDRLILGECMHGHVSILLASHFCQTKKLTSVLDLYINKHCYWHYKNY